MNYGFARTVQANIEIAKISPAHDINRLGELMDNTVNQFETTLKMMLIMNAAYESREKYRDPNYKGNPLTREVLMNMDDQEFMNLSLEALSVYNGEAKAEVEAEPKKSKSQPKK